MFSCAAKSAEQLTRGGTHDDSVFLGETQAGRGVRGTADGTYPETGQSKRTTDETESGEPPRRSGSLDPSIGPREY